VDFIDLVKSRRTIRLFKQDRIAVETLIDLVDAARLAPSASNIQPLEYVIVSDPVRAAALYKQLAWAAYIQPARNASPSQRPVAYIVVLRNSTLEKAHFGIVDAAAAIENILLCAWSKGIGSCWLASVKRDKVSELLNIPETYVIDSVIALGYPDEAPVAEAADGKRIEYYLDAENRLHVPKRPLKTIAHMETFGKPAADK